MRNKKLKIDDTAAVTPFTELQKLQPGIAVMLATAFEVATTPDQIYAISRFCKLMYAVDLNPAIEGMKRDTGSLSNETNFLTLKQAAIAMIANISAPTVNKTQKTLS